MRSALIDLGTNSVRLHIFEHTENSKSLGKTDTTKGQKTRKESSTTPLRRIFQRKEMIQLGAGLFSSGDFTPRARDAALNVFAEFQNTLSDFEVRQVHAVATCAMREAKSGKALRDEIERVTGIRLKIISGKKEAELIAKGILSELGPFKSTKLLIDIGGGSTELSYVKGGETLFSTSLPLGAVRCQEVTLRDIPASKEREQELRRVISETLSEHLPEDSRKKASTILGSSGSIRAIGRLITQEESGRDRVTKKELSKFVKSLRGKTEEELQRLPGLEAKRARIIFSASVILDQIADELKNDEFQAVPLGLKDGLIAEIASSTPNNP